MKSSKLKKKLQKGKTPAARSIGIKMPAKGKLTTYKDADGVTWVQVDNGTKRYKAGLPDYNEDAKNI